MRGLLQDWENKNIYTVAYTVINDKGIDTFTEKVLAYDSEEAEQIIRDFYQNEDPNTKIEFSKYNPIKIDDFELFVVDKLDEAHIIRRGSSYRND